MKERQSADRPRKVACASKYGTAGPVEVSVGYHAWAMTCRWSDGLAVSVSGRWLSVQRKISLPTLVRSGRLGQRRYEGGEQREAAEREADHEHASSGRSAPAARVTWAPASKRSRSRD